LDKHSLTASCVEVSALIKNRAKAEIEVMQRSQTAAPTKKPTFLWAFLSS